MVRKKVSEAPVPLFGGPVEATLVALVAATVMAVAFGFTQDVNRVFDVSKATYLKLGGGIVLLIWLGWGALGPGFRWRSARLFAAPVVALVLAVGISTLLSIDPITSEVGVYERQFGFQGYLACAALFFAATTGLASARGAYLGLGLLAAVGGLVGTYAHLQGSGLDPIGFFKEPNDKVWSFLGNATFAGNSLALLFPMTILLAGTCLANSLRDRESKQTSWGGLSFVLIGFAVVIGLQVFFGRMLGDDVDKAASFRTYRFIAGASLVFIAGCAALGSGGPTGLRLEQASQRRVCDQLLAGALLACVVGIALGIFHSRTRAAWVGSTVAIFGGLVLLPWLFPSGSAARRRAQGAAWGGLGVLIVAGGLWATLSPDKYARTVRSIPAAFDPERTDYGKGQGTRPYLWGESIRVLVHHDETLQRLDRDRRDYRELVEPSRLEGIPVHELDEGSWSDARWREIAVWLFGIGIETYRYAFMSHKSLELEAMDPMTNHDNPHNNYLYLLASLGIVGLLAYLWLLARLLGVSFSRFIDAERARTERAVALGIVTSFFSYAVYSIAGFDSIASSIFLYTMLGAASVSFEPNADAPREPLGSALLRRWKHLRGESSTAQIGRPLLLTGVLVLVVGGLAVRTMALGARVYRADAALVRAPKPGENPRDIEFSIKTTEEAIRINPYESFYRQQLGSTYTQKSGLYRQRAVAAQRKGDAELAQRYVQAADEAAETGLSALMSALHHAWAPENIFITAFQLYYQLGRVDAAINALERAFDHSPHLGELRAQLALLQLEKDLDDQALNNCRYAIKASRNTPAKSRRATADLVCGRVLLERGRLEAALGHFRRAERVAPDDPRIKRYLQETTARMTSTTARSRDDRGDQSQHAGRGQEDQE